MEQSQETMLPQGKDVTFSGTWHRQSLFSFHGQYSHLQNIGTVLTIILCHAWKICLNWHREREKERKRERERERHILSEQDCFFSLYHSHSNNLHLQLLLNGLIGESSIHCCTMLDVSMCLWVCWQYCQRCLIFVSACNYLYYDKLVRPTYSIDADIFQFLNHLHNISFHLNLFRPSETFQFRRYHVRNFFLICIIV